MRMRHGLLWQSHSERRQCMRFHCRGAPASHAVRGREALALHAHRRRIASACASNHPGLTVKVSAVLQRDLWEHERMLEAWCPQEHQARMRFAMTECGSTEWSGAEPLLTSCTHPKRSKPGSVMQCSRAVSPLPVELQARFASSWHAVCRRDWHTACLGLCRSQWFWAVGDLRWRPVLAGLLAATAASPSKAHASC